MTPKEQRIRDDLSALGYRGKDLDRARTLYVVGIYNVHQHFDRLVKHLSPFYQNPRDVLLAYARLLMVPSVAMQARIRYLVDREIGSVTVNLLCTPLRKLQQRYRSVSQAIRRYVVLDAPAHKKLVHTFIQSDLRTLSIANYSVAREEILPLLPENWRQYGNRSSRELNLEEKNVSCLGCDKTFLGSNVHRRCRVCQKRVRRQRFSGKRARICETKPGRTKRRDSLQNLEELVNLLEKFQELP